MDSIWEGSARAIPANPLAPAVKYEGTKRRGTGASKTCLEPGASSRLKSPPPRDTPCPATAPGTKDSSWAAAEPLECTDVGSSGSLKTGAQLRAYILAPAALHPTSHSAPPSASHSARGRRYFPPGRWAREPRGLPAPALGSSGAEVATRRRPLSRTGFVLLLVAGHRETSCQDARGQGRLASACPHRAPGPTFVLFLATTHRRTGQLGLCGPGAFPGWRAVPPRGGFAFGLCMTFPFGFEL